MPVYMFSCGDCGTRMERRAGYGDATVPCPRCNATAARESVYRVNSIGFARTPSEERDWSQQYKDFSEASQEVVYESERRGVESPPLFQQAKRKARELHQKGVTLDDLS